MVCMVIGLFVIKFLVMIKVLNWLSRYGDVGSWLVVICWVICFWLVNFKVELIVFLMKYIFLGFVFCEKKMFVIGGLFLIIIELWNFIFFVWWCMVFLMFWFLFIRIVFRLISLFLLEIWFFSLELWGFVLGIWIGY